MRQKTRQTKSLKTEQLTETEWSEVANNKTLQFAVLEQIRDNCKQLADKQNEIRPRLKPLEQTCNKLTELSKSNLRSNTFTYNRGKSQKPEVKKPTLPQKKLDPLNPAAWKSEEGA